MKKSILLICVTTIISSLNALTLDEALESALKINPEIVEKHKKYEGIYYDVQMATSGYLPKIDVAASLPLHDSRLINKNENLYDIELTFSQNIFNGFGDISKHRLESAKYKSAFYTIKELKNKFSLEVIKVYLDLLKEIEMQNIKQSSVDNHEELFNKITIKYNAGLGNKLEYRLAKTSLNLAKINYHEQKNSIKQSKISLEKYLDEVVCIENLSRPAYDVEIPLALTEALKIALETHPSLLVVKSNKNISEYEHEYSKKDLYPSIDVSANYYSGENRTYRSIVDEYYDASLVVSYNLYNGFYDINEKRKQLLDIDQKTATIEKTKRDIEHKLKSKYDEYLMLKEKKVLMDEYVNSKELALESYYDEFSIGKAQIRDILDTTESLYAAKRMQLENNFDLLLSKYNLLEAIGLLPNISYIPAKDIGKEVSVTEQDSDTVEKYVSEDVELESKRFCYTVIASILNIRKSNSTSSKILGKYFNGEIVCSKKIKNLWVETDDGWIYKKYLKNLTENINE